MILAFKNEYEKAIAALALRQYAQHEFEKAVALIKAGNNKDSNECSSKGQIASEIANRLG